ncbi:helix-turn-helix domain-containing protein [Brevundimonas sp. BT-123]|uniref:helix-turn-helix domain-containing protein n=1 Tax=Brevundimonas sp. BT-123 TaxID=2986928 RepID=UPI0022356A52|nr:helix-turn-helix domain-containing protein [Brevundimonas sp. BT-123]MCW0047683.1 helix-turn-helix domain-containing protein [Brevundimonas sp. BT-123]
MAFRTCPPPLTLQPMVRELWLLNDGGEMSAGLPKPYVELVVSLTGRHWWRATPDGQEHLYTESWVTPLQDRPRYARAEGGRRLMGARLEPWLATALFGPLSPGDGRPPPKLHDLLGEDAASLRSALVEAPDEATAFERFGTWLERRVAESAADIAFCVDTLSDRSTRRRYAREIGVSPKRWRLLHRLDRVLRDPELARAGRSFAHLAQDHGFSDQAHLCRELMRLTGSTPSRLRRRDRNDPPHLVRQD